MSDIFLDAGKAINNFIRSINGIPSTILQPQPQPQQIQQPKAAPCTNCGQQSKQQFVPQTNNPQNQQSVLFNTESGPVRKRNIQVTTDSYNTGIKFS